MPTRDEIIERLAENLEELWWQWHTAGIATDNPYSDFLKLAAADMVDNPPDLGDGLRLAVVEERNSIQYDPPEDWLVLARFDQEEPNEQ